MSTLEFNGGFWVPVFTVLKWEYSNTISRTFIIVSLEVMIYFDLKSAMIAYQNAGRKDIGRFPIYRVMTGKAEKGPARGAEDLITMTIHALATRKQIKRYWSLTSNQIIRLDNADRGPMLWAPKNDGLY